MFLPRAEVLLYEEERERYCTFMNGVPPNGSVSGHRGVVVASDVSIFLAEFYTSIQLRAPEEIIDAPLTEKIDVYALGNVLYSVLTGLEVNRRFDKRQAHRRLRQGKTEELDDRYFAARSPAEGVLVKVIRRCWTFDAARRPSIFEVVEALEGAAHEIASRARRGTEEGVAMKSEQDDTGSTSEQETEDSDSEEDSGRSW